MTVRIACWSGPRNVSTALMRSFEARGDCAVVDEPLYAAFLHATGIEHPGRDAILASQPRDPVAALRALAPSHGQPLQYEKHMAHHWQPTWPEAELGGARHAFLIRDPARVVASYARIRGTPTPSDLGLLQQEALLDVVTRRLGQRAVIVDGDELLRDPPRILRALCAALDVPYTDRMLSWPPGPRATDGVWAPHWYQRVEASTGFAPPTERAPEVPPHLARVVEVLAPVYRRLISRRTTR